MDRPSRLALRALSAGAIGLAAAALTAASAGADGTAPTAPTSIAAFGDSITAAWGSGGSPADNTAASWATGSDASVDSHAQRLEALLGSSLAAVTNVAASGTRVTDPSSGVVAQVARIPDGTSYALFGGGSADICATSIASTDQMTSVSAFTEAMRQALSDLANAKHVQYVLVSSLPDWYRIWQNTQSQPRPNDESYAPCPLLFGPSADQTTRDAVDQRVRDYDSALQQICGEFSDCRYDGGAVHGLDLGLSDLTTVDYFHPSVQGQAKIAQATWNAGWFAGWAKPASSSSPTITGSPSVGQALTGSAGSWTGTPTPTTSLQWLLCDGSGAGCTDISGATSSTYTPVAGDLGHTIVLRVDATSSAGQASADSTPTAQVAAAPTSPPTPSGGGSSSSSGGSSTPSSGSSGGGGGGGGPLPDLSVAMRTSPSLVRPNDALTYYLTVTDENGGAATGIVLDASLPEGTTLLSSYADRGSGCTASAAEPLRCALDFLSSSSRVAHVTLVVHVDRAGTLSASASVAAEQRDPNPANNRAALSTLVTSASSSTAALALPGPRLARLGGSAEQALRARVVGRVAVVSASIGVSSADYLAVSVLAGGRTLPLLAHSSFGTAVSGRKHLRIVTWPALDPAIPLRLRLPLLSVQRGRLYVIQIDAHRLDGSSTTLLLRFRR